MSHRLITSLALEGADGQFVELMLDGRRHVAKVDGLVGLASRERVRARPGRHGVINTTRYRDSLPIVVEGELFGDTPDDAWTEYNTVAAAAASAVASDRQLRWSGGTVLDLMEQRVRVSALSPPITVAEDVIRYQLTLRPEDPRSFSQTESIVAGPFLAMVSGGKTYPYAYPRAYSPAASSDMSLTVGGTDSTPPVFRIYGLAVDPVLELVSTGEQIALNGTVDAGTYVEVDVDAREVRLEDGTVRNDLFDFQASTWFELPHGPQTVRLTTPTFDATAHPEARYRAAYA